MKKTLFPTPIAVAHFLLWGLTLTVMYLLAGIGLFNWAFWFNAGLLFFLHLVLVPRDTFMLKFSTWCAFGLMAVLGTAAVWATTAPLTTATRTLSNGQTTVVFQEMYHIATPAFYDNVRHLALVHANAGDQLFREGVQNETPEEWDNILAQLNDGSALRKAVADSAGLELQNNRLLDGLPSVNPDITAREMADLMAPYAAKNKNTIPQKEKHLANAVAHLEATMDFWRRFGLEDFNMAMNRARMRYWTRFNDMFADNAVTQDIVLGRRDALLVKAVTASKNPRIFVVYGGGHFPGFFGKLRAADPSWREIKTETLIVF